MAPAWFAGPALLLAIAQSQSAEAPTPSPRANPRRAASPGPLRFKVAETKSRTSLLHRIAQWRGGGGARRVTQGA